MINILCTCAGRRNYIVEYFQNILHGKGGKVYAANSDRYSSALSVADEGFIVPSLYDDTYIDVLVNLCQKHQISAIIPLFDLELPVLAQAKPKLEENGIQVVVSSVDVIQICNDKWLTNQFLEQNKLSSPKTYQHIDHLNSAIDHEEIRFPIIIKPRWGMGSIGLNHADDFSELSVLYSRTIKDIQNTYLLHESFDKLEFAVLFQEKLVGVEFGLDIINDLQGEYVTTLVKQKITMRSGETDCAVTVQNDILKKLGEKIGKALKHVANLDVDVIMTEEGPFVLELNPRIGGGYPFSHLAGANLPQAIVTWLEGGQVDPSVFAYEIGVTGVKSIQPIRIER